MQPSTVALGIYRFDLTRDELRCGDQLVRLSASEARLLNHLAQNAGLPLSRHSLTRELGLDGGGRTIDVQVARLRRKFEPDPKYPRYLRTVRGKGYVLQPD